jgi:5-methylcytosine-specific restriction enzyme A
MSERTNSGKQLNIEWNVGARDCKYHKDGTFYMGLDIFPGALFDTHGYILFKTEEEYRRCSYLAFTDSINGEKINVHQGISSIPGYRKMK